MGDITLPMTLPFTEAFTSSTFTNPKDYFPLSPLLDIPGLLGWWDNSLLASGGGSAIASVPDQSGNGHALTQGTTSYKPLVYDSYNLLSLAGAEQFSGWGSVHGTLSTDGTLDPLGNGVQAELFTEDTTTNQHKLTTALPLSLVYSSDYSVYLKPKNRNVSLYLGTTAIGGNFDLINGVVSSGASASITNVGNGWYRCAINGVAPGSTLQIQLAQPGSFGGNNYAGDGASGCYVWGAQVTQSSSSLTYDHTRTTGAINGLKSLQFDGVDDGLLNSGSMFDIEDVTAICVFQADTPSTYGRLLTRSDGSGTNPYSYEIRVMANGTVGADMYDGTTELNVYTTGTYTDGLPHVAVLRRTQGSKLEITVDSEVVSIADTLTAGASLGATYLSMGSASNNSSPYTGLVGSGVVYAGGISDTDKTSAINYLKSKWGVA